MSRRAPAKGEDGKKKKQQAASQARRMAGKKGQSTQLQTEVHTEEEWDKLLTKEGLIVIDVYSDWSGPCLGMIGNLRKIKVEIGGDNLHLATAKSDEIECLERFRNKSEPTWLFVVGGLLVSGMFGANAPRLMKMIDFEIKKEMRVMRGETWRQGSPFSEYFEEEKERLKLDEKKRSEYEKTEAQRKARQLFEKRIKLYNAMAEHLIYETVVLCFPHTVLPEGCVLLQDLNVFARQNKMNIITQAKININREMFDEIFFLGGYEPTEDLLEDLESGPSLAILMKSQLVLPPGAEGEKKLGDIERMICAELNMCRVDEGQEVVIPNPNSIPAQYPYYKKVRIEGEDEEEEIFEEHRTSIPGCWTPPGHLSKCAALKHLFPSRADKITVQEEAAAPPVIVIAFDITKQKEKDCFEIAEENPNDVLNIGYFSSVDPHTAEPVCATREQYARVKHLDTDKLVVVVKEVKDEPLLSYAGLGAVYVSADNKAGQIEADLFFPPGVEPYYARLEDAERALAQPEEAEEEDIDEEAAGGEEEAQEEEEPADEAGLMALLGVTE